MRYSNVFNSVLRIIGLGLKDQYIFLRQISGFYPGSTKMRSTLAEFAVLLT